MKVLDNVKERRKILDLKVKCMNKREKPPWRGNHERDMCNWTGELRVYKVTSVWKYIHIKYFTVRLRIPACLPIIFHYSCIERTLQFYYTL